MRINDDEASGIEGLQRGRGDDVANSWVGVSAFLRKLYFDRKELVSPATTSIESRGHSCAMKHVLNNDYGGKLPPSKGGQG